MHITQNKKGPFTLESNFGRVMCLLTPNLYILEMAHNECISVVMTSQSRFLQGYIVMHYPSQKEINTLPRIIMTNTGTWNSREFDDKLLLDKHLQHIPNITPDAIF